MELDGGSSPELTSGEGDSQAGGEARDGQNVIKTPSCHKQSGDSLNAEEMKHLTTASEKGKTTAVFKKIFF